jgi:hypothetical protein
VDKVVFNSTTNVVIATFIADESKTIIKIAIQAIITTPHLF